MPIDRANVDTDAILPKQYLKSVQRSGFGPFLFDDWRYIDPGDMTVDPRTRRSNPDCVLNLPRYTGASILLARENFGCGSSREHAPWAIADYGFRALIAPSFADIFRGNCLKNGLLPIIIDGVAIDALFDRVAALPGYRMCIDLQSLTLVASDGWRAPFALDSIERDRLLGGLDEVALTLEHSPAIRAYEAHRQQTEPWLFVDG